MADNCTQCQKPLSTKYDLKYCKKCQNPPMKCQGCDTAFKPSPCLVIYCKDHTTLCSNCESDAEEGNCPACSNTRSLVGFVDSEACLKDLITEEFSDCPLELRHHLIRAGKVLDENLIFTLADLQQIPVSAWISLNLPLGIYQRLNKLPSIPRPLELQGGGWMSVNVSGSIDGEFISQPGGSASGSEDNHRCFAASAATIWNILVSARKTGTNRTTHDISSVYEASNKKSLKGALETLGIYKGMVGGESTPLSDTRQQGNFANAVKGSLRINKTIDGIKVDYIFGLSIIGNSGNCPHALVGLGHSGNKVSIFDPWPRGDQYTEYTWPPTNDNPWTLPAGHTIPTKAKLVALIQVKSA